MNNQLEEACEEQDILLSEKEQKIKDDLSTLKTYQRLYKKAVAGMIRTEEIPPTLDDIVLMNRIINHNKQK